MVFRFFLLLLGFGISVIGGISLIAYLNLLVAGFSFIYYLQFIIRQVEFYIFIIGIVMIATSIYFPSSQRY